MKKKIIISITTVTVVLFVSIMGIVVGANYIKSFPREEAYPETWYRREDIDKTKKININESAKLEKEEETVKLSTGEEKATGENEQELTYVITNGTEKTNPLDIYQDEDKNEYRYNQEGKLDTYKQNFSNKQTVVAAEDKVSDEDRIVELAWKYVTQLYGDRVTGFSLKSCRLHSEEMGYYVEFAKMYGKDGSISGAGVLAVVRVNGELGASTIHQDLLEDFEETRISDLTKEKIMESVVPKYEVAQSRAVAGTSEITGVQLIRKDGDFALRVLIKYTDASGNEQKDVCYYDIS